MKCPRCLALNAANDAVCFGCGTPLGAIRKTAERLATPIPQWAYLFAVACGIIPVVAIGGAIPIALGLGGAGGCLSVARTPSIPMVLRFFLCVGITLACWAAFLGLCILIAQATAH